GDVLPELVEPLTRQGRHLGGVGEAVAEPPAAQGVDGVDLVQDDLDRELARLDLAEHGVHRLRHLLVPVVRRGRVADVQHTVGAPARLRSFRRIARWRESCLSRLRRIVTRRRARRRSVSSWDSPGPRVPTPPPRRSRCFHRPRMRGRLYSSCASSTWSLPSADTACWAKMSRMSWVRSTTRALSAFSRNRCCDGSSSSSTRRHSAPTSPNC